MIAILTDIEIKKVDESSIKVLTFKSGSTKMVLHSDSDEEWPTNRKYDLAEPLMDLEGGFGTAILKKIHIGEPTEDEMAFKLTLTFTFGDSSMIYHTEGKTEEWPQENKHGKRVLYSIPLPEIIENSSVLKQTTLDGAMHGEKQRAKS